jgi:DNA ligase (NAD+)
MCGHQVTPSGSFLYCRNRSCGARSTGLIKVWVGKLGLLHWGDALIESLTGGDDPAVSDISDLYELSVEDLVMHSSGLKFAQKCHQTLHSNKKMKLETMISSVNIPNLGISTAVDLVQNGFDTLDKLLSGSAADFEKVPNIGSKTAQLISFELQDRSEMLRNLVGKLELVSESSDAKLRGMSFCVTGSTGVPRKALQKMVIDNGGVVKESVVSGLSFLITNEDLSSFTSDKARKAAKYGTKVISEADFLRMVD